MEINTEATSLSTKQILHRYKSVFEGTGLLKDFKLKLHIDLTVTPVKQPIRVPYHTKEKISAVIDPLLAEDIIEKVDGLTTWLNSIVPVIKPSGKIRLCLDMRQANKAIIRERHVIPKLEDRPD